MSNSVRRYKQRIDKLFNVIHMRMTRLKKHKKHLKKAVQPVLLEYLKQSPRKFADKFGDSFGQGVENKADMLAKDFIDKRKKKRYNRTRT